MNLPLWSWPLSPDVCQNFPQSGLSPILISATFPLSHDAFSQYFPLTSVHQIAVLQAWPLIHFQLLHNQLL